MMVELISIGDGHFLAPAPAASYLRARAAGCPAGITSSYRDPVEQQRLRTLYLAGNYPAYVAPVEKSEHVTGNALDLPPAPRAWFRAHPEYGFAFTDPTEDWHVAYRLVLDRYAGQVTAPAPIAPTTSQEDNMLVLARQKNSPEVYLGDGITKRHIKTDAGLRRVQFLIREGFLRAKSDQVQVWEDIEDLGVTVA